MSSPTLTTPPVCVVVTRRVPEAQAPAFEALLHELITAAARQPGHVSAEVLQGPGAPGARDYHIVYRFTDTPALRRWERCDIRRALLARLDAIAADRHRSELTGLEAWFDLPTDRPPSRPRMAVLTWTGIWPLVSALLWFCAPHLRAMPSLARTATITAAAVVAMTWGVMPALTRLAGPWIRPSAPPS